MKQSDYILNNESEVLTFLRARYPLYHLSNVFFRDVQYGIQTLLDRKSMRVNYREAERIARDFVARLERKRTLVPIDRQTWALHYPEFRTPPVKVAAAQLSVPSARPAGTAAPAAKPTLPPLSRPPAGSPATTRPPLPPLNRPAAAPGQKAPAAVVPTAAILAPDTEPTEPPGASPQSAGEAAPAELPVPRAAQPPTSPAQAEGKTSAPQAPRQLPPIRSSTPAGPKRLT
jgi:hypothetical protein